MYVVSILNSVLVLGTLGLIFGAILAYASKKFAVDVDERVESIIDLLGVGLGVLHHAVDFLVGKRGGAGDGDGLLLAGALVLGGDPVSYTHLRGRTGLRGCGERRRPLRARPRPDR